MKGPIGSINQLGKYIDEKTKAEDINNIFGLYVIGKGDIQPLIEQIRGSKYKERMRILRYEDLLELLNLKEELEIALPEKDVKEKIQNILLPIESINIGNLIRFVIEIATTKSAAIEGEGIGDGEEIIDKEESWSNDELTDFLNDSTKYQRFLWVGLVQCDEELIPLKSLLSKMNDIVKKKFSEEIDKKIVGKTIAGARAGLKMRRKPLNKEAVIESSWNNEARDFIYKVKDKYKETIINWVKKENLLI